MNIRALTGFLDPGWPLDPRRIGALAVCMKTARDALQGAGYPVQSLRLATPPPAEMDRPVPPNRRQELARQLEAECFVHGIDYACLGPALAEEPQAYAVVPEVLAATESVFLSGMIADRESGLSLVAARGCAQAIAANSTIKADGFANLRFAALANVPPGAPFFPAGYHGGGGPAIAVAAEAAELAVDAMREVTAPPTARRRLIGMIEAHAAALTRLIQTIADENQVRFLGLDFSLAPYPDPLRSVGTALEAFGLPVVGQPGTLAAAAFLADCLDRADFRRTGFNGLFLPVLEDPVLAARAADGTLTLPYLLALSAVCGTGLDTVPLPGDVSPEALTGVLADVGALALRLDKALTARLVPIPGRAAGDEVHFDSPYFADSRVMALPEQPLRGMLAEAGLLELGPRLID
ncbi:MAG: DUF711 family protein [Anaerolineales bacterium]